MRRTMLGVALGVGIVMSAVALAEQRGDGPAQFAGAVPPAIGATAGTELIVVPSILAEKTETLTVVDPRQRVICVYQIDAAGKIALKGVRNIQWDLQIECHNNEAPLPHEIRSMLERR